MGNRRVPPFIYDWGKDGETGKIVAWAKEKYGLDLDPAQDSKSLVKEIQDHKAAQPETPPVEERKAAKTDFDPEVKAAAEALPSLHNVPPLPDAVPQEGTAFATPAPGVSETTAIPAQPVGETADRVFAGDIPVTTAPPAANQPPPSPVPDTFADSVAHAPAPVQSEADPAPAPIAPQIEAPGEVADRKAQAARVQPKLPQPKDPSRPLDPYHAVGLEAGGRKKEGLFFLPDGTPLKPDTNPVLSEADADVMTNIHNIDKRTGQPFKDLNETTIGADDFNGEQRHTNFRHPQGTKLLLNPRTGVAFRPTELLMRKEGFTPHFSAEMPKGYVFGG